MNGIDAREAELRAAACKGCGSPMAETGAPIWESYCTNKDCTFMRDQMRKRIREGIANHESPDQLRASRDNQTARADRAEALLQIAVDAYTDFRIGEVSSSNAEDWYRDSLAALCTAQTGGPECCMYAEAPAQTGDDGSAG